MRSPTLTETKQSGLRKAGWGALAVFSLLMTLFASRYLTLNPAAFFPQQRATYIAHTAGLILHIGGSMLAMLIGPVQFLPGLRAGRWLKLHRWLGRVYLAGVLVGGAAGLYMATLAYGGLPARLGFASLAVLWLSTGWMAYTRIRAKQVESHREWMIRNFALTFAAVMLRLWLGVFQAAGLPFEAGYITVSWLCWAPNLLIAEWIIRRRRTG